MVEERGALTGVTTKTVAIRLGDKDPQCTPSTFMRHFERDMINQATRNVPCGSCNICCRNPKLFITLDDATDEHHKYSGAVYDDELGRYVLPKKDNGECVNLINGECLIYDSRPKCCKTYDCRLYALLGAVKDNDPLHNEAFKQWAPMPHKTNDDRDVATAIRMAVAEGGMPQNYADAEHKALLKYKKHLPAAAKLRQEFDRLPKDMQEQIRSVFEGPMYEQNEN